MEGNVMERFIVTSKGKIVGEYPDAAAAYGAANDLGKGYAVWKLDSEVSQADVDEAKTDSAAD